MADETTDVSNTGQMVIHLRCVTSGTIRTVFGGLVSIAARDAESLTEALETKCAELSLPWRKCHLGSDGASVFTGKQNKQYLIEV